MSAESSGKMRKRLLDTISFGGFLIVVGLVFYLKRNLLTDFIPFFESFETYVGPPPYSAFAGFYDGISLFFYLLGGWTLVQAAIKVPLGFGAIDILGTVVGGVILLLVGHFIPDIADRVLPPFVLVGVILIIVGFSVIIFSYFKYAGVGKE